MTESCISIIILTLNGARHLERLLKTFFETNTHEPVELIIIDHGSTDNTSEIVLQYAARAFIRLIKLDRNYSFASSCNLGASKARYPYLLFLNNDIIYTSDVLPPAMARLADPTIGAVGIRLDDDPDSLPTGKEPGVQHTGIAFEWDSEKEFYRPVQIRHNSLAQAGDIKSGFYPAVTGAFLLCCKADFEKLGGFYDEYDYGFEDIDFCLRMGLELNKQCMCINEMMLQHVDCAARKQAPDKVKKARRQNNDALFKRRMGEHVKRLISDVSAPEQSTLFSQRSPAIPAPRINNVSLNILFVLYESIDSNGGLHTQLHAARLMAQSADCMFAVPREGKQIQTDKATDPRVHTFAQIEKNGLVFADGRGPDIIHAWTPREVVRVFCEKLLKKYSCPLVIHLEDNEEYLTEVTVGRPFTELAMLPEKELDNLIPSNRYHPIRGRNFLDKAQGLTMIIDTLGHFNYGNVPRLVLPPPVDERLFYPRPLNLPLRKELEIPEEYMVLAYTGNVHAGNREEVRELYRAVHRLNEQGFPTVLIRTGINAVNLGSEAWITDYEKNLGWVERNRVPDILAAADVLVQPGTPGPFNDQRIPSKLPEYFAMGRPVILPRTNLGLKVEHLKEGYVLDKVDGEGIARAMMEINKDKEMAGGLMEGGRLFVSKKIHSESSAHRLYDFYRNSCSAQGRGKESTAKRRVQYPKVHRFHMPSHAIPIVVIAHNRPASLLRLLHSLDTAQYHQKVPLIISVDGGDFNSEVVEIAKDFSWRHGTKSVLTHQDNLGLKAHVIKCNDISMAYDGAVVLEDDLLVSPFFYSYTQQAFEFYRNDSNIAGISLYSHLYNETARLPFTPLHDHNDVFFMQVPSSWGVVWEKRQWAGFKKWLVNHESMSNKKPAILPGNVLTWPESSWKKFFFYYITEKNKFFVYPRVSLTTNFGETGVNMKKNMVFQVPLLYVDKEYDFITLAKSLAKYDAFCEILPESLSKIYPNFDNFDYSVDLYGMKPLLALSGSHVLTAKKSADYIYSFGKEMLPLEANIIHEIEGEIIRFARIDSCTGIKNYEDLRKNNLHQENILYYFNISHTVLHEAFQKKAVDKHNQDDAKTKLKEAEKELRQENKLLLLQLHQVQEELEHYFLKCRELENRITKKGM